MSRWFRLYDDILDDPKVQRLPPDLFKAWINLLCLASRNEGKLPSIDDIAFALRTENNIAEQTITKLADRGLLDNSGDEIAPHNWDRRQFKSDKDETAAERQRAKRERDRDRDRDKKIPDEIVTDVSRVTSHPPEQSRSRADTEQSRAEAEPEESRAAACVEIGKRITDHMGVTNDPRWMGNWSTVSVWLSQGFDPELDIMPTVMSMVDRFRRTDRPMPGSLKYFSKAIAENHQARITTGKSPPQSEPEREFAMVRKGTKAHKAWLAYYRKMGRKMAFYESQEILTVPSEFPPADAKVA